MAGSPKFLTAHQAAAAWGVSEQRVRQWLAADPPRIKGAQRLGKTWMIRADTERPAPLATRPNRKKGAS